MSTLLVEDMVIQAQIACYCNNQVAINTIYYRVGTVVGNITDEAAVDDYDATVAPLMKALLGVNALYYGVRMQVISPAPKRVFVVASDNQGVGTATTNAMPGQVTGILSCTTDFAGPRQQGRIYLPFPAEEFNDPVLNSPTEAYIAAGDLLGFATYVTQTAVDGANTAELVPVLYDRNLGTTTFIQDFRTRQKWGTQMRRGNYGPANQFPPF